LVDRCNGDRQNLNNELNNVTQKNDMVITIGAGTIWRYGHKYFEYLLSKEKAA